MIKKVKKGFTLIELVVVIAVIAILSAVSVVAYVGITNNAKKSAASQKAAQAVTTIRAAVLASPTGYEESKSTGSDAAVSGKVYVVTLDGKELKLAFKDESALSDGDDIKILKDLLGEVGEPDLAKDEIVYSFKTVSKESKLGVLIDGKDKTSTAEADFEWASF